MNNNKSQERLLKELADHKTAYQELEQKFDELKKNQDHRVRSEKLAALSQFVSNMAHKINNPLMVIAGRVELSLMDGLKDERAAANFKIIRDQCDRVKDMIRKLLMFSKPGKGTVVAADINALLETAIKSFEEQILARNITLEKNLSPSLPKIQLDEKQMKDVFVHLMRNAMEAMPEGGTLTISTSEEGKNILIHFRDTGRGMSRDDLKEIFDPFFTTKDKGAGLGLSMCYGIIKGHGGELRYESAPNQGTTAALIMPAGQPVDAKGLD